MMYPLPAFSAERHYSNDSLEHAEVNFASVMLVILLFDGPVIECLNFTKKMKVSRLAMTVLCVSAGGIQVRIILRAFKKQILCKSAHVCV